MGAQDVEIKYVASKIRDRIHTLDCKWSAEMDEENRIYFLTPHDAMRYGFRPCRTCCPEFEHWWLLHGAGISVRDSETIRRYNQIVRQVRDDGRAIPGRIVSVRFDDGETQSFMLTDDKISIGSSKPLSVDSALGRAVNRRIRGDIVEVEAPGGTYLVEILDVIETRSDDV